MKFEKMTFSEALIALKNYSTLRRKGWNGKGMRIFLVDGSTFLVNRPPLLGIFEEGHRVDYNAHIDMQKADGTIEPWIASQGDLLADDWMYS